jgi:hypothetical protein
MTINAPFFREIKEDHEQVRKLIADIDTMVAQQSTLVQHPRQFLSLIDQLVDQLALHFALEEAYGYFENALEEEPHFHDQAMKLRGQHSELYLMMQHIAEATANACDRHRPDLDPVARQYKAFEHAFKAHESAELHLILEALNRDLGTGD